MRFAPGATDAALTALAAELGSATAPTARAWAARRRRAGRRSLPRPRRGQGRRRGVLWGERLTHGDRGRAAVDALLALAAALDRRQARVRPDRDARVGQRARPARGGLLPGLGPGLADAPAAGRPPAQIAEGLVDGELSALVLLHADPVRTHPERGRWEQALDAATS